MDVWGTDRCKYHAKSLIGGTQSPAQARLFGSNSSEAVVGPFSTRKMISKVSLTGLR